MLTVCNLHSMRRGHLRGLGIEAGAIPAGNLYSRMSSKPFRSTLCAAVRQQIDDFAALQVTENWPYDPCWIHQGLVTLYLDTPVNVINKST